MEQVSARAWKHASHSIAHVEPLCFLFLQRDGNEIVLQQSDWVNNALPFWKTHVCITMVDEEVTPGAQLFGFDEQVQEQQNTWDNYTSITFVVFFLECWHNLDINNMQIWIAISCFQAAGQFFHNNESMMWMN